MTDEKAVWLVVPAYNEQTVIGSVIRSILTTYPNVVVVDDCSADDTGAIARAAGARVVRHPINLGQGAALQTGLEYAIERDAEFIVTFDADGQHRLVDVAVLLEVQDQTKASVVLGSRFLGATIDMPAVRRAVLRTAVFLTNRTSGLRLTDAHNGLRLFTKEAAKKILITQNRMAHASEITTLIATHGLSVSEAPVTIVYTEYSLQKGQRLGNAVNILLELILARFGK